MKGIILAGGLGTRLRPLTNITNKHLLPVYNKPMVLYPLDTLIRSGLKDIMIVCGREYAGDFMNFLGSGKDYGVRLSYALQEKDDGGVADALRSAKDFADQDSVVVILGDNIFEQNFQKEVNNFKKGAMGFSSRFRIRSGRASRFLAKIGKKSSRSKKNPKSRSQAISKPVFICLTIALLTSSKRSSHPPEGSMRFQMCRINTSPGENLILLM